LIDEDNSESNEIFIPKQLLYLERIQAMKMKIALLIIRQGDNCGLGLKLYYLVTSALVEFSKKLTI
jgi:hypothetical protein